MKKLLPIASIFILFTLQGCMTCIEGEGEVTEEERLISLFDELDVECSVNVFLHQDSKNEQSKAIIKAQPNLIPNIKLDVSGDKLTIETDHCMNTTKTVEIHLYFPMLTSISVESSANLYSEGRLKTNDLEVEIDGSGDLELDVKTESLETTINGSGDIKLSGKTDEHDIEINGSGDVLSFDLSTKETEIEINGSGSCEIDVSESLDILINGSGDVKYKGNPEHVNQRINGSGEVQTIK